MAWFAGTPAWRLVRRLTSLNLVITTALCCLVIWVQRQIGAPPSPAPVALVGFSTLIIYNIDHARDAIVEPKNPTETNSPLPHALAIFAGAAGLILTLLNSPARMAQLVIIGGALCSTYAITIPALGWRRPLKNIPGFKSFFVSFAISSALVTVPMSVIPQPDLRVAASLWCSLFGLIVISAHAFDTRDHDADQLSGVPTLPVALGNFRTRLLITGLGLGLLVPAGLLSSRVDHWHIWVACVPQVLALWGWSGQRTRVVGTILVDGILAAPLLLEFYSFGGFLP
jgi:4-hydroxybenzoate polyprenyltransferase